MPRMSRDCASLATSRGRIGRSCIYGRAFFGGGGAATGSPHEPQTTPPLGRCITPRRVTQGQVVTRPHHPRGVRLPALSQHAPLPPRVHTTRIRSLLYSRQPQRTESTSSVRPLPACTSCPQREQ